MEKPQGSALDYNVALIVEDEPLARVLATEILQDAGYRVFEACDAQDALTILEERQDIWIVMTDIEMPGDMDGLALAGTIHARWPDTVILVTSGRLHPEPDELSTGAGFIAKPYRVAELLRQLDMLLEQHGVLVLSDDDILEGWHAAELAHAQADPRDKPVTLARAVAAEQTAIERFGAGSHAAAYDARYSDKPEPRH
jgi:CheY-like chemotaxis protein